MKEPIRYEDLPEHCRESVKKYIEKGKPVGGFLRAVFENNLVETFLKADDINKRCLISYVLFLYNDAPSQCYGSREAYKRWVERGGLSATVEEEGMTDDGWISVDEKLPEIMALYKIKLIGEAVYYPGMQGRWAHGFNNVTHWRELPLPPEQDATDESIELAGVASRLHGGGE